MVAGHASAPFSKFFYLFHMAIFFICSGFLFKDSSSDNFSNVLRLVKSKIKHLWFPYFVWSTIFTLLNNVFIRINIYTDNKDIFKYLSGTYITTHKYLSIKEMMINVFKHILFSGGNQMNGAFWFLRILFGVSISYCFIDYIIKKYSRFNEIYFQCGISIIFLLIGYYLGLNNINIFYLSPVFSCYILYYMGHILFIIKEKFAFNKWHIHLLILLISFLLISNLCKIGYVDIGGNKYTSPIFMVVVSLLGWFFLYELSYFINKTIFKKIFIELGKRTISIVILHFLCMKIVTYIVCLVYDLPMYCLAGFPNVYGNIGLWWLAYTAVGVIVPVFLYDIYIKLLSSIKNRII